VSTQIYRGEWGIINDCMITVVTIEWGRYQTQKGGSEEATHYPSGIKKSEKRIKWAAHDQKMEVVTKIRDFRWQKW